MSEKCKEIIVVRGAKMQCMCDGEHKGKHKGRIENMGAMFGQVDIAFDYEWEQVAATYALPEQSEFEISWRQWTENAIIGNALATVGKRDVFRAGWQACRGKFLEKVKTIKPIGGMIPLDMCHRIFDQIAAELDADAHK